jgi:hypothetical protein
MDRYGRTMIDAIRDVGEEVVTDGDGCAARVTIRRPGAAPVTARSRFALSGSRMIPGSLR